MRHLWLADPATHTLESYTLHEGRWLLLRTHGDESEADVAPFEAVPLPLADLWLPEEREAEDPA